MGDVVHLTADREIAFHPLAEFFPLMDGGEFAQLVNSIKENGLRDPIVTYEQKILDGRNRYRACIEADIAPRYVQFSDGNPVLFVIDRNLHRRHLNESQRALIAARLASPKDGQRVDLINKNGEGGQNCPPVFSAERAGEILNVSRTSVIAARKVLKEATPKEIKMVEAGELGVSNLAKAIHNQQPPQDREQIRARNRDNGKKKRAHTVRVNGQIWSQLRDALNNLTSLPLPKDVVPIARSGDKTGLVDKKLLNAHKWLEDFLNEWTNGNEA